MDIMRNQIQDFLQSFSKLDSHKPIENQWINSQNDSKLNDSTSNIFVSIPSNVNHTSVCYPTVPYSDPDYPSLQVLSSVISNDYLHREIREKGGAYGGGVRHSAGLMSFFSYRDPNIISTLAQYNNSIHWAKEGNFTAENIDEAKLKLFASIDSPVSPYLKGLNVFNNGITEDMIQTNRNRLFNVKKK